MAVSGGSAIVVLGVGGAVTDIGPWYNDLRKPRWQPPGWLFAPAWTLILGLAAWAAVLAWAAGPERISRTTVIVLFAANGVLNVLWSVLFFKLRRPDWALIEVVPLWLSVLVLIVAVAPVSTEAAWFMAPYLAWVAFAAFLNLTIVKLNGRMSHV